MTRRNTIRSKESVPIVSIWSVVNSLRSDILRQPEAWSIPWQSARPSLSRSTWNWFASLSLSTIVDFVDCSFIDCTPIFACMSGFVKAWTLTWVLVTIDSSESTIIRLAIALGIGWATDSWTWIYEDDAQGPNRWKSALASCCVPFSFSLVVEILALLSLSTSISIPSCHRSVSVRRSVGRRAGASRVLGVGSWAGVFWLLMRFWRELCGGTSRRVRAPWAPLCSVYPPTEVSGSSEVPGRGIFEAL
jgi:hypothetical protein